MVTIKKNVLGNGLNNVTILNQNSSTFLKNPAVSTPVTSTKNQYMSVDPDIEKKVQAVQKKTTTAPMSVNPKYQTTTPVQQQIQNTQISTPIQNSQSRFIGFQNNNNTLQNTLNILQQRQQTQGNTTKKTTTAKTTKSNNYTYDELVKAIQDFHYDVKNSDGKLTKQQISKKYPEFKGKEEEALRLQEALLPYVKDNEFAPIEGIQQNFPDLLQNNQINQKISSDGTTASYINKQNDKEWNDEFFGRLDTTSLDDATGNKVKGFLGNLAKSTWNVIADVGNMVVNPLDTANALAKTAVGAGMNLVGLDDNLSEEGWLAEANQIADGLGDFLKERYGGVENIKKSLYEDPAGVVSDIATLLTGIGGAIKGAAAGTAKVAAKVGAKTVSSNAGKVSKIADKVMNITNKADPYTQATNVYIKGGEKAINAVKNTITGEKNIAKNIAKNAEVKAGALETAKTEINGGWSKGKTTQGVIGKSIDAVSEGLGNIKKKVFEPITDAAATKITSTATPQDKLFQAVSPSLNRLTNKRDNYTAKRNNADRTNELIIEYGYQPKNSSEYYTDLIKTKQDLWKEIQAGLDEHAKTTVNSKELTDYVREAMSDDAKYPLETNKADLAKLTKELDSLDEVGELSLERLEAIKQQINAKLNYGKNAEAGEIYEKGLREMNKKISEMEDQMVSELPGELTKFKKDYGALKDMEEDVLKMMLKDMKKKSGGSLYQNRGRLEALGKITTAPLEATLQFMLGESLGKARDVNFLIEKGFKDLKDMYKGEKQTLKVKKNEVTSKKQEKTNTSEEREQKTEKTAHEKKEEPKKEEKKVEEKKDEDSMSDFIKEMEESSKVVDGEINYGDISTRTLNKLYESEKTPKAEKTKIEKELEKREAYEQGGAKDYDLLDHEYAYRINQLAEEEKRIGKVGKNDVNKAYKEKQSLELKQKVDRLREEMKEDYKDRFSSDAELDDHYNALRNKGINYINEYKLSKNYSTFKQEDALIKELNDKWGKQPKFVRELTEKQQDVRESSIGDYKNDNYEIKTTDYQDSFSSKSNPKEKGAIYWGENPRVVTTSIKTLKESGLLEKLPDDMKVEVSGEGEIGTIKDLKNLDSEGALITPEEPKTPRNVIGNGKNNATTRFQKSKKDVSKQQIPPEASKLATDSTKHPITDSITINKENTREVKSNLRNLSNGLKERLEPKGFLQKLKEAFKTRGKSVYVTETKGANGQYTLRISNHEADAFQSMKKGHPDNNTSLVIKLAPGRFKPHKEVNLNEFLYDPEKLTLEKQKGIIKGIEDWLDRGEYTDKNYDNFNQSTKGYSGVTGKKTNATDGGLRVQKTTENNLTNSEKFHYKANGEAYDKNGYVKPEYRYNPREGLPTPRGGWTKKKIEKYLHDFGGQQRGEYRALDAIREFDNAQDFKDHTFYHGTASSFAGKPSMSLTEKQYDKMADRFGGGYGQRYWSISLTTDKKIASNFGGASSSVSIYPVILRKNAKVIEMPKLQDAIDLDEHIEKLWNDGVDAVWIGDKNAGEKELSVLNPNAIVDLNAPDSYRQYHLGMEDNPLSIKSDKDFDKIYEEAPELQENIRKAEREERQVREKWFKDNYGKTYMELADSEGYAKAREARLKFEESEEAKQIKSKVRDSKYDARSKIRFQKAGKTTSKEFKDWFGDWEKGEGSKVVDKNGDPLVVYHGTPENFTEFKKDMIGANYGQDNQGFFFTDDKAVAQDYADTTSYGIPRSEKGNVMEVYLDIKNPLIKKVDFDPIDLWDNNYEKFLNEANKNGNDGIIIKADKGQNMYVPFEPEQIKSATDNVGTFDKNNPDIRFQQGENIGRSSFTEKSLNKAIENMKKTGLAKDVKTVDTVSDLRKELKGKISKSDLLQVDGEIAGCTTPDGTVYLVKEFLRDDTLKHEFAHRFRSYAEKNNPELFKAINKVAEEAPTELKERIKRDYGELSDDALLDEVFAWKQGEFKVTGAELKWYQKMWKVIEELWNSIKSKFGKNYADLSAFDGWEKMSSEQIMSKINDILENGKKVGKPKNLVTNNRLREQAVWHGSPADFDKFDSTHMGEGEGAQAHGWGHYVAVEERTGRHYADLGKIKGNNWEYDGKTVDWLTNKPNWEDGETIARNSVLSHLNTKQIIDKNYTPQQAIDDLRKDWSDTVKKDKEKVKKMVKDGLNPIEYNNRIYQYENWLKGLDTLDVSKFKENGKSRNLYNLEIPDPIKKDTPTGKNYLEEDGAISKKELEKINNELLKKELYLDIANNKNLKSVSDMTKEDVENIVNIAKKSDDWTYNKVLQEKELSERRFETSFFTLGEIFSNQLHGRLKPSYYVKLLTEAGFKPDLEFVYGKNGKEVYRSLENVLGSDKKASKFLESLGYDGIHYFGGRDGEAYVIFNDDALKINSHTKYQKTKATGNSKNRVTSK